MGNLGEINTRKASQKQGGGATYRLLGLSSVRCMGIALTMKLFPLGPCSRSLPRALRYM